MAQQKSIYYMSDRELRDYRRAQRVRLEMRRKMFMAAFTLSLIVVFAVAFHAINTKAATGDQTTTYKYYTSITVEKGDTLWDIAEEYIDYSQCKSIKAYVNEVQQINRLKDASEIRSGQSLIIPYYSSEFVL